MKRPENLHALVLLAELLVSVCTLCLYTTAYARDLRTTLWDIGGQNGCNSNPRLRVYFVANHKELPEIPVVWSHELDISLLAIATLGLVVWSVKATLLYFHMSSLGINMFYDAILSGLWIYGVAGQMSGDFTDPKHPSARPWYLLRSCSKICSKDQSYCSLGKLSFSLALLCMILYSVRFAFFSLNLIYSCVKNQLSRKDDNTLDRLWETKSVKSPYLATAVEHNDY